ncbi:MAG: lysozyme inhibitor LprI family protein [Pseudorhodoplanes sp.]
MSQHSTQFAVALVALLVMASATVHAEQANPADIKTINACLKKADESDKLGTGCIGLVADPCRAKTENDTDKNRACARRELLAWDAISEAAAKLVRGGGYKEISKALADSEKSWASQRDALCPVFDKVEPGWLPGDANYCRMQTTANRALLLRKLGAAVNPR